MRKATVIKFGGKSLASLDLIRSCAQMAIAHFPTVVVVSAMGNTTDELKEKLEYFNCKENIINDFILSSGEQIAAGLFAAAINEMGRKSQPICGWQVPIKTKSKDIIHIETEKLIQLINANYIPVVTGFQGINEDNTISTLLRGGSDITAVAIAAAMKADCYIYTDVDGVYLLNPKVHTKMNKKYSNISYERMLEMSLSGAKVLHPEAVRIAKENQVEIYVKSSFNNSAGTLVNQSLAT